MSENEIPDAKVLFKVSHEDGNEKAETLWAYNLGSDEYRIHNLRFYAYNISLDDIVLAPFSKKDKFPTFEKVLIKSGNRTVRLILDNPPAHGNASDALLSRITSIGCAIEGADKRYLAINVPPSVAMEALTDILTASTFSWESADPADGEQSPV